MVFNRALFKHVREKGFMRQADFARELDVSKAYVSAIEKGLREPGLDVIGGLVRLTGIPVGEWLFEKTASGSMGLYSDMKNRTDRDHLEMRRREDEIWRLEGINDRVMAKIRLYEDVFDILQEYGLSKEEKEERFRKLVIRTIREGALVFAEVQKITRVNRSTIRNWLDVAKQPYECSFAEGGKILASSPGEAGLFLRCFTCMKHEDGYCVGYGDECPANIEEMLERLDANGIYDATEQSVVFEKYYDIRHSAKDIIHIRHKIKNKIHIPDDVYYMDTEKRDV
jgi:transcriptional regulator with XRE-family HTH domain